MANVESVRDALKHFTVSAIYTICSAVTARMTKMSREDLLSHLEALDPNQQTQIILRSKTFNPNKRRAKTQVVGVEPKKQRTADPAASFSVTPIQGWDASPATIEELTSGIFLDLAPVDVVENCISRGMSELRAELFMTELRHTPFESVPNAHLLQPLTAHPAHNLTDGKLIHIADESYLCGDCERFLTKAKRPPLSLGNNMWIGEVPTELQVLSLAERLLISRYFPAAYIIKLYPRKMRAAGDVEAFNQALRGNVSSYRLNTDRIADMVSGNLLPHPIQILAATIGITFVGVKNKTLAVYPEMVRVNRMRVFEALVWLKANNPVYAEIAISEDNLLQLPEDDVPSVVLESARFSDDVDAVRREHATYVPPSDDADDEDILREAPGRVDGTGPVDIEGNDGDDWEESGNKWREDVFPIQASGIVDTSGHEVTDEDLFQNALLNTAPELASKEYGVRKGNAFVNEYARTTDGRRRTDGGLENPNHILGAFPFLFPYGVGGLEVDRDVNVPYENHVRWALQYTDGRFRRDIYFIFLAFGVLQKRSMCRAACLQIKRSSFATFRSSFQMLKLDDLKRASEEEARHVPISDPVVRSLRRQLTSVRAKVAGTDESRIAIRSQIWAMSLRFNPPTLWATINLSDTSDPVAQVLAGAEIDLDRFIASAGPQSSDRVRRIASDPYASAEFFHVMIKVILEELFGIRVRKKGSILREEGTLGVMNGYIGTVEAQARGSLHLHILFWLKGAPTASLMKAALATEAFRSKVKAYISQNIRAHLSNDDTGLLAIPKTPNYAYSRPEDPRVDPTRYPARRDVVERSIARSAQAHQCFPTACLRMKDGKLVCKRRAPWSTAHDAWVRENGDWGPKRSYARLNAFHPPLAQVGRCNHDLKLVTNGAETKNVSFYVTMYVAKKQGNAANASALLAKTVELHAKQRSMRSDDVDENKLLLQRCANTLSRQQELSGPEVISYLMNWGDRFLSHTFVRIYWDEVTWALRKVFPSITTVVQRAGTNLPFIVQEPDETVEPVSRIVMVDGQFVLKDQLKEYTDRGLELTAMSMYDYFAFTYDGKILPESTDDKDDESSGVEDADDDAPAQKRTRGRPRSQRVPYLEGSQRKSCRIVRGPDSETVVQLVGRWIPRSNDVNREYYAAQVLALLKPWRKLDDLYEGYATFSGALVDFLAAAGLRVNNIVDNLQYYHDCGDSANERRAADSLQETTGAVGSSADAEDIAYEHETEDPLQVLTEADVVAARLNKYPVRETIYGEGAMAAAYGAGIFDELYSTGTVRIDVGQATQAEHALYEKWGTDVAAMSRSPDKVPDSRVTINADAAGDVVSMDAADGSTESGVVDLADTRPDVATEHSIMAAKLNSEQKLAHDIVEKHLRQTIQRSEPRQLLMVVRGEGGTGKSVLINTLSELFASLGVANRLALTATTGVAASLIGGQTIHMWSGYIPSKTRLPGPATVQRRKENIQPTWYLVIDEYSMLTKRFLLQLSQIMGNTKEQGGNATPDAAFGNINVILCGDLHQFPPVADPFGALYYDEDQTQDGRLGLQLYHQFDTVVTLTQQMRVRDPVWMGILKRLRHGACTADDIEILRSLLVKKDDPRSPNWNTAPWDSAVLVTPRHGARVRWNAASLSRHSGRSANRVYVCPAEDLASKEKRPLSVAERVTVAGMSFRKTGNLEEEVELTVGMRAMVMFNIATEADLANGTRGIITDIKLDPREPMPLREEDNGKIRLKYPPSVVFFKADHSRFGSFEELPEGVLPIVPSRKSFSIPTGSQKHMTVKRRQYAVTAGYAFTDYKSQGQTLEYTFVDLAAPKTGKLTPFSAYVALSRSRGRNSIRILRGFELELFTTHPSARLAVEDVRLDKLSHATIRKLAR